MNRDLRYCKTHFFVFETKCQHQTMITTSESNLIFQKYAWNPLTTFNLEGFKGLYKYDYIMLFEY